MFTPQLSSTQPVQLLFRAAGDRQYKQLQQSLCFGTPTHNCYRPQVTKRSMTTLVAIALIRVHLIVVRSRIELAAASLVCVNLHLIVVQSRIELAAAGVAARQFACAVVVAVVVVRQHVAVVVAPRVVLMNARVVVAVALEPVRVGLWSSLRGIVVVCTTLDSGVCRRGGRSRGRDGDEEDDELCVHPTLATRHT